MIEFRRVTKLYGTVIGLNDVTLELPPGGYGLIGPNGAGKTTLLHLLLGVIRPTIGQVMVLGENPFRNAKVMKHLGYCPAVDGLHQSISGWQWVNYLLQLSGVGPAESAARATDVLQQVGMHDAMHRSMQTYSRGMRQRVKFAQAFAHHPHLLVLDEPFNGLDPVARHELTNWLKDWLSQGKSLILASHVLHEVESVVNSFLLICGGRLLASGSSREVDALLSDIPNDVRIRCRHRERLATRIIEAGLADSVSQSEEEGVLVVSTRASHTLLEGLPRWNADDRLGIESLESSDESLQAVFDKLFRMHRGEL